MSVDISLDPFIDRFGPSEREQQQRRVYAIAATWTRMMPYIKPPSQEWLERWAKLPDSYIAKGITLTARKFSNLKRPVHSKAHRYAGAVMFGVARARAAERGRDLMAEAAAAAKMNRLTEENNK